MRTELELTEKIENYLQGKLSATDEIAFEKEIQSDPSLRMEVDAQKEIMNLIDRVSLKSSMQNAYMKYNRAKTFRNWSLTGLTIIILILAINYASDQNSDDKKNNSSNENAKAQQFTYSANSKSNPIPIINSSKKENTGNRKNKMELSNPELNNFFSPERIEKQSFLINNDRDTTVKGKSGILIKIPKNTFANLDGSPIKGTVKLDLQEALKKIDMVMGGLITKSDNTILESGGMLNLDASVDGEPIGFANNKSLKISVPYDKINRNMKLYDGILSNEQKANINWANPRGLTFNEPKVLVHVENRHVTDTFGYFQPRLTPTDQEDQKRQSKRKKPLSAAAIYTEKKDSDFCYSFSVIRFGWSNCDCPYYDPTGENADFNAIIENESDFKNISICMVYENVNVITPGRQLADHTFSFSRNNSEKARLPVGKYALLIANACKSGRYYFATKKIKLEDKEKVKLKLVLTSEDEIRDVLTKGL